MIADLRQQFLRFSAVGICATVVHLLTAMVCHYSLGMTGLSANFVGFAVAWLISYFGNYVWTFGAVSNHRQSIPLFMVVSVLGFAINQLIVWFTTETLGFSFSTALILVIAVVPAMSFLGSRFWAFRPIGPGAPGGSADSQGLDRGRMPAPAGGMGFGVAMTCAVLIVSCALQLPLPVNHDAAWVLIGAAKLMEGAAFGRDVVDNNPPLAWWISTIPVVASAVTGLALPLTFKLFVIALAASSGALSHGLLRQHIRDPRVLWFVTSLFAAVMLLQPGYDFGQREHFMVILVLPYLCLSIMRMKGGQPSWTLAAIVGVIAALGICLKPFFLAVPLAVELSVLVAAGRLKNVFRIENSVMLGCGSIYVIAVLLTAPAYFSDVLPAVVESYDAYDVPWSNVFRNVGLALAPIVIAVLAVGLCSAKSLKESPFRVFLWAAIGALVSAILQRKGWSYHIYPAAAFAVMGTVLAVASARPAEFAKKGLAMGLVGGAIAFAVARAPLGLAIDAGLEHGGPVMASELAQRLETLSDANDKVFAFITSPRTVMPAVLESERHWASTACCLHYLPAAIQDLEDVDGNPSSRTLKRAAHARDQLSGVADDLERNEPKVIVVDAGNHKLRFGRRRFDYLEYVANDMRFIEIFSHYREVKPIGHFRVFIRKHRHSTPVKNAPRADVDRNPPVRLH